MELRKYQIDAISRTRDSLANGNRKVILHAPTGAGKTVMSTEIISLARGKGSKVLFLANRRELIFQAKETMIEFGISPGVIMAGEEPSHKDSVQIASMQTYVRRMNLSSLSTNPWFHDANIIIVDECHSSISPSYQKILQSYKNNVVTIGLTATPCRGDGRGLGEYYDDIISTADIGDLISQEFLVPVRYFVPSTPDLAKIKTIAGDYDKKELGARMDNKKLVGDIVDNWLKICPNRKTIIFAVNVKHSKHIINSFISVGIEAEHIDARTPAEERAEVLNRLKNGSTQIVSNVGILTEGFDFPAASCIVLARPTKSLGLYLQMAGRGLRIFEGKGNMILIDHGGCVEDHGLVEWSREWSLDGEEIAWKKKEIEGKEKAMLKCRACNLVYENSDKCPDCGTVPISFGKKIETVDADLEEVTATKTAATMGEKRRWYGMMLHYGRAKGWSDGAAAHRYREKFKVWPKGLKGTATIEPDNTFLSYQRHLQIKYAKSKNKR